MLKTLVISLILLTTSLFADEFFEETTKIGGYGELHINHKNPEKGDASNVADFHRFVTFISHNWTEKWSFNSELELEHNFVKGGEGELELEQAYVSYKMSDSFEFQAGVLLPRVGLINEGHEPPLFLSSERASYNKSIIPTTWFGNGFAILGNINNMLDYKVTLMEGLDTTKVSAKDGIRKARQKGYKSSLNTVLLNFAIDYTGFEGLRAGASFSRNQKIGNLDEVFDGINVMEAHVKYTKHDVYFVTEFGMITYSTGDAHDKATHDLEASMGYYAEVGYNVGKFLFKEAKLFPWVSFSQYNTASSTDAGGDSEEENKKTEIAVGLTFLPISSISFKLDFTMQTKGKDDFKTNMINGAVGFMF